jgi:hypothetical protein
MRSVRRHVTLLLVLATSIAWPMALPAWAAEPTADGELKITAVSPRRGVYRLHAEATLPGRAAPLLAVLADYEAQCKEGCRYTVPSITRTEILLRQEEEDEGSTMLVTWTRVDDVLSASYWSEVHVAVDGPVSTLRFLTPRRVDLARWADRSRPHEPFFFDQHGTWTLTELTAESAIATHVEADMEMRSERFAVNLLPGRVLAGTRRHVEILFTYLREAAATALPATPGAE